ncbi:MAG TPA: hypothetical protein GX507_10155 [Clostridia bacterium]|nr:hypothetical protein [Clostridia bacterium]
MMGKLPLLRPQGVLPREIPPVFCTITVFELSLAIISTPPQNTRTAGGMPACIPKYACILVYKSPNISVFGLYVFVKGLRGFRVQHDRPFVEKYWQMGFGLHNLA